MAHASILDIEQKDYEYLQSLCRLLFRKLNDAPFCTLFGGVSGVAA